MMTRVRERNAAPLRDLFRIRSPHCEDFERIRNIRDRDVRAKFVDRQSLDEISRLFPRHVEQVAVAVTNGKKIEQYFALWREESGMPSFSLGKMIQSVGH